MKEITGFIVSYLWFLCYFGKRIQNIFWADGAGDWKQPEGFLLTLRRRPALFYFIWRVNCRYYRYW